jgi:menaquinone-dependent protoporphyrinogen IX oxidase
MKGVIIYEGKYGATQQYAKWISDELGFPVIPAGKIEKDTLNLYDIVVLGSPVYIGKLKIAGWLKKNFSFIRNKKLFLYQVAGAPPSEIKKREEFNSKSLPVKILERCKCYYLAGRLIISKLSWFDRFMLKMGARMTKDPVEKKGMLTDYDMVKRENINTMVADIRSCIGSAQSIPGESRLVAQSLS